MPYPTYPTGPQPNGSWVVSNGQIITPAGTQVDLGIRVRAKAIALNPIASTHTAAVLTMGATQAVEVFDTSTGVVLQNYITLGPDSSGSYSGISLFGGRQVPGLQPGQQQRHHRQGLCRGLAGRRRPGQRAAEQFLHHSAFRTARRALMPTPAARSILRALLILAASRSQRMARAPMPC